LLTANANPLKITLISTYHRNGGAGVAATRLHHALLKQGLDSTLLVVEESRSEPGVVALANNFWQEKAAFARFVGERLAFLPHERDKSVRFQFSPARAGADLSQHPAVQQADVIHLHWTTFGMLSVSGLQKLFAMGKSNRRTAIIWTMHDMWAFTGGCHYSRGCTNFETHCHHCPFLTRPAAQDLSYRVFERKKAALANAPIYLVSPSNWLANLARKAALTQQFETHVIPNPIDTEVFRPTDKRASREKLGLPTDQPLLLFGSANTSDPRKGFSYFAQALNLLKNNNLVTELAILLFGKSTPEAFAELPFVVHSLGVLTNEADIVAAYNAADALVVPSLEDNLPNTIVESLACGTPVIAFKTGGISEMIQHQKTGYLAQTGSATELADGLNWLLNQTPEQRTELSQNTRQFALLHYAEAIVAQQYQQLYNSAMEPKNSKP
jgi:glycosyltransferase involved in cell wall biosynthesis